MPKLLSQSKHEEFKSNLALKIKKLEERIVENRRKCTTAGRLFLRALCILSTVPPVAYSSAF